MVYLTDPALWKKALKFFQDPRRYEEYQLYYRGHHPIAYASEKWRSVFGRMFSRFADNLCPPVVNAVADRLIITGFAVEGTKAEEEQTAENQATIDALMEVWNANRMDFNAGMVMRDALRDGDNYIVVWPDPITEDIHLYPNEAGICRVCYDRERPGKVKWAVKAYKDDDGFIRLTLYFTDRIEKYVTNRKRDDVPSRADAFIRYDKAAGNLEDDTWPVQNPYGVVPVFHFANDSSVGKFGVSELDIALPIQNALNKSVLDLLAGMEYIAFPQRWITGMSLETNEITGEKQAPFKPGVDRIWTTPGPNVKFGQFDQADMKQFIDVNDSFRMEICRLTGIPLHYFQMTGDPPSGEALRALEARLVKKVLDRQAAYGNTWEDIMRFVRIVQTKSTAETNKERFCTQWKDPAPTSEKELAETAEIKMRCGVPQEQLWKEMGYTDAEIADFTKLKEAADAATLDRELTLVNRGSDIPPPGAGG